MTNRTLSRQVIRSALSCIICDTPGTVQPIELDHIYERSTHPHLKDEPLNLAPLCSGPDSCHGRKSIKEMWTWLESWSEGALVSDEVAISVVTTTVPNPGLYYCWSIESKHDPDAQRIEVTLNQRYKCLERIGETNDGRTVRVVDDIASTNSRPVDVGDSSDREGRRSRGGGAQAGHQEGGSPERNDGRFHLKESHVEWGELTFQDWREAYEQIASVSRNNPWWLGDAWVEAEDKWPDSLYQSGEELAREAGKSPETISNYANVCRAVAPPRRRGVPLSLWSVVYKMPQDEQETWIDRAVAEHLTERELRALVRPREPQAKRYSVAELRELADEWERDWILAGDTDISPPSFLRGFIARLEEGTNEVS